VSEESETLLSDYVRSTVIRAGLGSQYDISRVQSVEGASRYVAKYLFKPDIFKTIWPKGFRRVRYSQSFPKLPERKSEAFVLITKEDWYALAGLALILTADNEETRAEIEYHMRGHTVIVKS
jgi:hypothetical protein